MSRFYKKTQAMSRGMQEIFLSSLGLGKLVEKNKIFFKNFKKNLINFFTFYFFFV